MAIDWAKARQMMTSNPGYRGTRSPTRGANEGRGGMGNFRRTGRRFGPAGGPVPTSQQVAANRAAATPWMTKAKNVGQGIVNTGKNIAGNILKHPLMMGAKSIANNLDHHAYLDDLYGDDREGRHKKNMAFWNQAMMNWDATPDQYDPDTGELLPTSFASTSERPGIVQFGKTDTGTSLGQAGKYFKMAGIGDATMRKFLDPNYKFHANENWLRAQAEDKEKFDTGMSFIKNAKATANLARAAGYGAENVENAYEGPGQTIGAAGGPIPDMDITSDIVPKEKPRYINPGQTPGPAGMGLMPNMQMNYEPLTAAGSGMISGYNRAEPGPFEYLPFYSSPWDLNFSPEDYEYGLYPPDEAYPGGGRTTYAGGVNPLDRKLNAGNVGGSPTMGGNLASIDALGNRGYNVDNQGTIMPNITVEFTGDEEEESGKINPAWNKGRLGLYN